MCPARDMRPGVICPRVMRPGVMCPARDMRPEVMRPGVMCLGATCFARDMRPEVMCFATESCARESSVRDVVCWLGCALVCVVEGLCAVITLENFWRP